MIRCKKRRGQRQPWRNFLQLNFKSLHLHLSMIRDSGINRRNIFDLIISEHALPSNAILNILILVSGIIENPIPKIFVSY